MILDRKPVNLNEVKKILNEIPENEQKSQMEIYVKKFIKISAEKAKKIKESIEKLDLLKLKNEHIVKIIDLMPEDVSDLNKIFTEVTLNEDEINKILEIVKQNK